jgi:hypothetical protein
MQTHWVNFFRPAPSNLDMMIKGPSISRTRFRQVPSLFRLNTLQAMALLYTLLSVRVMLVFSNNQLILSKMPMDVLFVSVVL